jgi:phenylalanyl-tRNA synthetase beta chain
VADNYLSLPDPMYLSGRVADIYYRMLPNDSRLEKFKHQLEATLRTTTLHDMKLGTLGILHPSVLEKFEISFPCTGLEFSVEPFKKLSHSIWANDI